MARITVEDCLDKVDNRFQLVLIATKRTRQLASGAPPLVDRDNDKDTVIALREIAEGLVTKDILDEDDGPQDEFTLTDDDIDARSEERAHEFTVAASAEDAQQFAAEAAEEIAEPQADDEESADQVVE